MKNGNLTVMRTAILVDIGKCLLIRATAGEEVIGDVIMMMVKDGLPAVGEDDQPVNIFSIQNCIINPQTAAGFFIVQQVSASTTFHPSVFSRHGFRLNDIRFLFLLNNF